MNAWVLLILLLGGSKIEPADLDWADQGASKGTDSDTAAADRAEPNEMTSDDDSGAAPAKAKVKAAPGAASRPARTSKGSMAESAGVPLHAALHGPIALEQEAGGSHLRLETNHGPVHLFRPPGFDRRTAGVVVYVHGYYTHIDEAWYEHHLAEQFAASRRNALFIAPEAPAAPEESPSWSTLRRLLNLVFHRTHIKEPGGPLVVVGHSGAYRTLVTWLDEPALHQLILIDALYGNQPDFLDWLGRERTNRMTLVVKGTAKWADPFVKSLPYAITLPRIPRAITDLSRSERGAKLLCLRSQYGHFELITEGRVMPVLLGRCGLRASRRAGVKDDGGPSPHHGRRRAGPRR